MFKEEALEIKKYLNHDEFLTFTASNGASSMPAVDADNISRRQEILKEINEKHENPADEVMDVSSEDHVDKEIKDPERIKSASNALQVIDIKSYGSLIDSIMRNFVSQSNRKSARPPNLEKTPDKNNNILDKQIK